MHWSNRTWLTLVSVATVEALAVIVLFVESCLFPLQPYSPAKVEPTMAEAGRDLFHHEWKPGDPLSPDGDGLGPVFNATSCVACHNQGGSGGGGSRENNVKTFSIPTQGQEAREGVLHASATTEEFQETIFDVHPEFQRLINDRQLDRRQLELRLLVLLARRRLRDVGVSEVNTPALFGSGLIDVLPDRVLLAEAESQRLRLGNLPTGTDIVPNRNHELPVGRVSVLPDGRIGKFGWKGQTASLSEFVQAACANELGLGNPNHPQPRSLHKPEYVAAGLDLTQQQCDQITAYVASLDRPMERLPADPERQLDASAGKVLFGKIGCAHCHTPKLGEIEGIYSDLLLHRMNDRMAGAAGYRREPVQVPTADQNRNAEPSEWRTPPLWGVADSAPYMHDGRADSLEEAIGLHGGQGKSSATRFDQLNKAEQGQVVTFLKTLRAS